jgi:hypothetical protein
MVATNKIIINGQRNLMTKSAYRSAQGLFCEWLEVLPLMVQTLIIIVGRFGRESDIYGPLPLLSNFLIDAKASLDQPLDSHLQVG